MNYYDALLSRGQPRKPESTDKPVAEPEYHNLGLLLWLLGCASEAMVVVAGVEMMALVDIKSQVSTLNRRVLLRIGVENPTEGLLHLKGTVGIAIPYKGYIEASLIIPGLPLL